MLKQTLLNGFRLNIDYTVELVSDVEESDMTEQPHGFANHPAFTLGHLVTATALTAAVLGDPYEVPNGWDELFRRKGPGDPRRPTEVKESYPSKSELLAVLNSKYELVIRLVDQASEDTFEKRSAWKLDRYMGTVGELLFFQCMLHHSWHIGQLAEWRRMMGYPSALKRLTERE